MNPLTDAIIEAIERVATEVESSSVAVVDGLEMHPDIGASAKPMTYRLSPTGKTRITRSFSNSRESIEHNASRLTRWNQNRINQLYADNSQIFRSGYQYFRFS